MTAEATLEVSRFHAARVFTVNKDTNDPILRITAGAGEQYHFAIAAADLEGLGHSLIGDAKRLAGQGAGQPAALALESAQTAVSPDDPNDILLKVEAGGRSFVFGLALADFSELVETLVRDLSTFEDFAARRKCDAH